MPTTVQLPEELERRLDNLAKETGRSKADYIAEAVAEYLEDLEDMSLAEQTLKRIRQGKEKTYSLEEVEREFGLDS